MGEDAERNKPRFLAFWRQLAAHVKQAPDSVVLEILNEPNKTLTPALWNTYLREALAVIRETNPTRTVIVGPAYWNSIDHLKELELPAADRHLIVTVDDDKPMAFTHPQGAPDEREGQERHFLGHRGQRAAVRTDFERVDAWAKEQRRPILLGEFGAYDRAPMESRVRYTDCVARTAESLGWSWGRIGSS